MNKRKAALTSISASGLHESDEVAEDALSYCLGDEPPIETLFTTKHVNATRFYHYVILMIYFPFGFTLMLSRLFFFTVFGVLLALVPLQLFLPKFIVHAALPLCGMVTRVRVHAGALSPVSAAPIIVSNHRTAFDVFPFLIMCPVNVVIGTFHLPLFPIAFPVLLFYLPRHPLCPVHSKDRTAFDVSPSPNMRPVGNVFGTWRSPSL
eukprot:TRINITY_DN16831_c0_g1_i1.p1 TRINITY_DN16831_c0_g1~~TRINITY_DN16831_c0_g1_i1.p1  ORF type:complete len:207 (+),score=61.99 TRINITY_DN16831_c0_g1_i1:110-730(+)